MDSCFFCGKDFTEVGYVIRYKDHLFCNESCLAKQLLDDIDDETEAVWIETEVNLRLCAEEKRTEW